MVNVLSAYTCEMTDSHSAVEQDFMAYTSIVVPCQLQSTTGCHQNKHLMPETSGGYDLSLQLSATLAAYSPSGVQGALTSVASLGGPHSTWHQAVVG